MRSLKIKIYSSLLVPFISCGIGLFSIIHFFSNPEEPMEKHFYLWGIAVGVLVWAFEVRIIYDMITRTVKNKIGQKKK